SKNTILDRPVHLLFLTVARDVTTMIYPRNIFLLEDNSRTVILEEHVTIEDCQKSSAVYYKNVVTQIMLEQNAQLDCYKLQRESLAGFHQALTRVNLAKDSQFSHHNISQGGQFGRDDLHVSLQAPGASCRLNGLYVLRGTQHVD